MRMGDPLFAVMPVTGDALLAWGFADLRFTYLRLDLLRIGLPMVLELGKHPKLRTYCTPRTSRLTRIKGVNHDLPYFRPTDRQLY